MAEIPFGPYEPDKSSLSGTNTSYVKNVLPTVNGYAPARAIDPFTNAMTGNCRGMFGAVQLDGTAVLFAGSDTALYQLDGTTRDFTDVTRTVGGAYAVAVHELWDFCQFGNMVIATTDGNAPQEFTIGTSTDFAALSGSPPNARRCSVVGDFVVLSSLSAAGEANRIQWSAFNDATGWTVGTDQCDYQEFPDGGFVQGVSGGEIGIVFQDRAIRRMVYVGPPNIFEFQRISDNKGVMLRYSICKSAGLTFFLSNDGFYKIDLSGQLSQIGANRVNTTVLDDLDTGSHRYMVGVADPTNPRVMWFYKSHAVSGNYFDKVIVYDWARDRWSPIELTAAMPTTMLQLSATLEGLDAVSSSLDALPFSLDNYTYEYAQKVAVMNGDNKVGFMDGDTLEATLDTPEGAVGNGTRMLVRGVQPVGDADNAYVSLRYRDRLIDSLSTSTEYQIGVDGFAPARTNARFQTARARIAAAETWTYMRGVEVNTRPAGRR